MLFRPLLYLILVVSFVLSLSVVLRVLGAPSYRSFAPGSRAESLAISSGEDLNDTRQPVCVSETRVGVCAGGPRFPYNGGGGGARPSR